MTFCFDIDGIICSNSPHPNYCSAHPLSDNIAIINALYDAGHKIILNTSRGWITKIDWQWTTENQLQIWGVKYHELYFNKPYADYYVDDKNNTLRQVMENIPMR